MLKLTLSAMSWLRGSKSRAAAACLEEIIACGRYFRVTLLRSVAETGWPNLRKATYPSPNLKIKLLLQMQVLGAPRQMTFELIIR